MAQNAKKPQSDIKILEKPKNITFDNYLHFRVRFPIIPSKRITIPGKQMQMFIRKQKTRTGNNAVFPVLEYRDFDNQNYYNKKIEKGK